MRVGVSNFIGERLTEAREARGILTMTSLADLLKKSKNLISLYENNKTDPSPQMVSEMADLLKVKESFFFMPLPEHAPNPIFWRSQHISVRHARTVAERKFGWSKWLIDVYLKSFMEMPKLNIPNRKDLGVPDNPNELGMERIEEIAVLCREFWGLGLFPIENITALLENNGILISCGSVDSEKLDAFSNVSEYDGSYHMFLGMDKGSATRSRLNACHELGHLILHSHLKSHQIPDKLHRHLENQAYRFAGAFLMPAASFKDDVWMTSIEAFKILKKDWKSSVGAIIKRCEDLKLLGEDDSKARSLWIKYRKEWEVIELDDFEVEKPQLMKRCIDALLESGLKTREQILYELPFMEHDIESLLALPEGYLREGFGELKELPKLKSDQPKGSFNTGNVLPFESKQKH